MSSIFCDFEPAYLIFFSANPPTLLYYSHFIALFSALVLLVALMKDKESRKSSLFISLAMVLFVIWTLIDVFLWATNKSELSMFWWSIQILIEPIIYVLSVGAFYVFARGKYPSFKYILTAIILLTPLALLLPTDLTLYEVNLYDCIASESSWIVFFTYFLEISSVATIVLINIYTLATKAKNKIDRTGFQVTLFSLGLIAFLIAFTSGNIIGSLTENWVIAQYGLFGLPVFIGVIGYLIVQFRIYHLNVIGAQALILSLIGLTGSLTLISEEKPVLIVSLISFVLTLILGYLLIKSVKKEVEQKEQLEVLTQKLEKANERLKQLDKLKSEFVSIASHQLRSPLTAIRGYASLILDGSFGKVPKKVEDALERISESAKNMAYSIEDYLNVSRIESGNMKYNLSDFNLKDEAENVADDLRPQAIKKGLSLIFRTDLKSKGVINADVGKVIQIIQNLTNNSIKYTKEGSIKILVRDDVVRKKIYIDIEDTGVGIPQNSIDSLFGKFERASNANTANIHGTGLGLFVAHQMATAMGGNITAYSEGEGKGSRFTIEFPLAM